MDFSKLTPVSNANPTGQNFVMKWNPAKEEFRFSDKQFNEMQLEYNSLTQFDHQDGNVIYLGVVPGNDGVFYKKTKGAAKGKRFKNGRLSQMCSEIGLDPKGLTLTHLGTNGNVEMYELSSEVITPPAAESAVEAESVSEERAEEIEAVDPAQMSIGEDSIETEVNHVEPINDKF